MKLLLSIIFALFSLFGCSNSTSPSSDNSEDLFVTPSMKSSCPDTSSFGLYKNSTSKNISISCETWLWNYEGKFIAHHFDSGSYDSDSFNNSTCSNASVYEDLKGYNKSGYFFFKIKSIIDGVNYEDTSCYYVDFD